MNINFLGYNRHCSKYLGINIKLNSLYNICSIRNKSSGRNQSPTFLDITRATMKMTRATILLLLHVCICYCSNISTKPLHSNRGIFTELLPSNAKGIFTDLVPSNSREFLLSCCLATIRKFLPSRCLATIGGIHRHTHTHRQQRDLISILYFFKIRKLG
jgi:hypothetical protein